MGMVESTDNLQSVDGIGPSRSDSLKEAGYDTTEDIRKASITELSEVVPTPVARDIKDAVAVPERLTNISEAKDRAQDIPGAKARVVKGPDGKQHPVVMRKQEDIQVEGANIEIHKG